MRFSATHRITTHLSVLFANLSLVFSGELSFWVCLVSFFALALSWFWVPKREGLSIRIAILLGAVAVVYSLLELLYSTSEGGSENLLLLPFAHFLLLFQSTRLFTCKQSRDYLQIYVISFFELITATALNEDITYALCFLCYSISITWALILFHLRREMEDNYLLRHSDDLQSEKVEVERILNSKRIVSGSFLLATGALMFVTVILGSCISLLFPRAEGGPPSGKWRKQHLIGFSDGISLGQFGRLRNNFRVAMRVSLPEKKTPLKGPIYFQGLRFDTYDGRSWSRNKVNTQTLSSSNEQVVLQKKHLSKSLDLVDIFLEPIDPPILFLPGNSKTIQLMGEDRKLLRDNLGSLSYYNGRRGVVHYRVQTYLGPQKIDNTSLETKIPVEITKQYLTLPVLEDRVASLAKSKSKEAKTSYEKAIAIQRFLRREYAYSTELTRDETLSPLEDFLFVQKKGHCEYFATAMAILLRTQGIPSRVVNGFYGGEWNEFGGYYSIYQGDAHSWVEAYFAEIGWVRFDPTPASPSVRGGVLGFLGRFYDSIQLRWFTYVVDYDLFVQKGLLTNVKSFFIQNGQTLIILLLCVGFGGLLIWLSSFSLKLWYRRKQENSLVVRSLSFFEPSRKTGEQKRIVKLYRRMVDMLAKQGFPKQNSMTVREYIALFSQKNLSCPPILEELSTWYEEIRFGNTHPSEIPWDELNQKVKQFERSLSQKKHDFTSVLETKNTNSE